MKPQVQEPPRLAARDQDFIDRVIDQYRNRAGALLSILERVQEHNPQNYLPADVLEYIAAKTDIPLAQIHSVVTFYSLFNLEPQGRNSVCICRGTACHTRGSRGLLERLKLELGLHSYEEEEGGADKLALTTRDGNYTLRTVACFGQCALAPVVEVNHRIYGHVNEQALEREIRALEDSR